MTTYPSSLYGGNPPHVEGDTSTAAAESVRESSGTMRDRVHALIREHGAMTCDDAEVATGFSHQSCSARIRELVQLGLIHDSGERDVTRSGRMARLYRDGPMPVGEQGSLL